MRRGQLLIAGWLFWAGGGLAIGQHPPASDELSVVRYGSIQEALTANPGRLLYVPPGEYRIAEKIRIRSDQAGLFGPGRIVQANSDVPIIEIEGATGVQLRDLVLTRAEGARDTKAEAVLAIRCRNVVLEGLQVLDNRTASAAIALRECRGCQVRHCLVQNYMRISVDDRTGNTDWGYAFRCIDGSGISVGASQGTLLQGNRIIEENLLPTREIQQQYDLGKFVKRNPEKGKLISQKTWDQQSVDNWHQGSAIIITSPESSDGAQILGNFIENAAQGIDIHADRVIVSQNIVQNAFIGMKAMHGSRHVLILGNQFSKNDLWAIGLMPGASSHGPGSATGEKANVDGGSVIAHNIISDFGGGHAAWVWQSQRRAPIRLDTGQKPENPPLADVIIEGNIVYDSPRDERRLDDKPPAPSYRYAVLVAPDSGGPRGLHFANNIFHPGSDGVSNVELKP